MSINRVLTDKDRQELESTRVKMQQLWPELYSRKIPDSLVQFAFCYDIISKLSENYNYNDGFGYITVLAAGGYEDIVAECLKLDIFNVVSIDPVLNCDLHTFNLRSGRGYQYVLSASVLEHVENDEEFVQDACQLLYPNGYGIFTVDFKDDWRPGQKVPYTSRRFYTIHDLTVRLRNVLRANNCDLIEEPDYSDKDRFVWDGINYSFATWVFKKEKE